VNTEEKIKSKGIDLFNQFGFCNVTLRQISQELGISYGNVTYHFSNKSKLLDSIYEDMNIKLTQIQSMLQPDEQLLKYFLKLPDYNFDITLEYIFFYKDFLELKRKYPEFYEKVEIKNQIRRNQWLQLLSVLQQNEYLKKELTSEDLNYIIELSISMRMFYFQNTDLKQIEKNTFNDKVNRLLLPYLSDHGLQIYKGTIPQQ
jgi:AcrR family transcriptional regulator